MSEVNELERKNHKLLILEFRDGLLVVQTIRDCLFVISKSTQLLSKIRGVIFWFKLHLIINEPEEILAFKL